MGRARPNRKDARCLAVQAVLAAWLILFLQSPSALGQEGTLDTMRQDVREPPPDRPPEQPAPKEDRHGCDHDRENPWACDDWGTGFVMIVGGALTSPFWAPHAVLGDSFQSEALFPRFPYDASSGYLATNEWPAHPRHWAARLDAEYVEDFNDLHSIGGHLLVSTTSRFGLDVSAAQFAEKLSGNRWDHLWLGDCNLVFRFAQNKHAEFRAGLGFNWLDDPIQTDFGFNFTYGLDLFPRKPWVVSSVLDWGTLGHEELFRFRTTVGVLLQRFEFYTGYEYTDLGRTRLNGLIGGVRVWF